MITPSPSFHPSPSAPHLKLPRGACDAHCHIFGPRARFPFAPDAPFIPSDAPKEQLFSLHSLLGIERCIIVQSTCHGFDNAAIADAIADKAGSYLGVALAPLSISDQALRALDAQGFRALRFNFMKHLGTGSPIERVIGLTPRLAELGWHLQVHLDGSLIEDLAPWFLRSTVPVVIDHMGRVDAALGLDQTPFRALTRLLADARIWVKLSGADRMSRQGPPYADALPFARVLMDECGDRVLWGTDWPHPNTIAVPDDGLLTNLVELIAPTASQRQALLVDNPQRLYRFAALVL